MRHPIVMVEGPEQCGKTYVARCVERDFGYRYCHLKKHRSYTDAQRGAFALAKKGPLVVDRHLWSDQVYGTVLRGGPENNVVQSEMWSWFMGVGGLLILCVPPDEQEALTRWNDSMTHQTEYYEPWQRVHITRMWYQLVFSGDYAEERIDWIRNRSRPTLACRTMESGGILRCYGRSSVAVYLVNHGRSSTINVLSGLLGLDPV